MYLVNYFFSRLKNRYCSKSVLEYVKDVNRIALLDWCQFVLDKLINSVRHYKEIEAVKRRPLSECAKERNKDDSILLCSLGLGLSESDRQTPVAQSIFMPDPKTIGEKHDANEDDDDGAPLIFHSRTLLRRTSSSGKVPATKHALEQKKESLRANGEQKATDCSKPKLTAKTRPEPKANKEISVEKDTEKRVGATTTPKK
ncbi:hypothetical protein Cgig2_024767 [Carnegiea gigantea]|uniref:Uncharacterized protein n=1 Tax=Carnegiea gigantea TaxID=171969 RepID=A0A9Q1JYZ3_9CARY|nr:hypothetical protein Cgig2_024767 [Carnegiea gigantea]